MRAEITNIANGTAKDVSIKEARDIKTNIARYGTIIGLVAMSIFFAIARPESFPTVRNLINILNHMSMLALISLGVTCTLIMGDFDLSIGAVTSLAGVLAIGLIPTTNMYLVIAVVIFFGVVVGLINGLIVNYLKLSAFIVTLGTSAILTGIIYWYSGGATLFKNVPNSYLVWGRGQIGIIPIPVIIMFIAFFVLWFVFSQTETGRYMYAIGGNKEAAIFAGINVKKLRILAFVIASLGAAIAGIVLSSRLGVAHPQAGDGYLLNAYAAAFLGASTLRDGEFNMVGTLIGVILVGVATNGLTLMGAPFWVQNIFTGMILIGAVSLSAVVKKES